MQVARVGLLAPEFSLPSVSEADAPMRTVTRSDSAGRWLLLMFYPRDFTFVCPTELTAFSARRPDFERRDCVLLGISSDPIELHREWLATPPGQGGVGALQFPLVSDQEGTAARAYGVWMEEKQASARGLFLVDPEGMLQYAVVHNLNVGRNPDEVLRVLDALRSGGLCPASWTLADGTIDPEKSLRPGTILGSYRIRSRLGSGTFGAVFAAWDLRLERMAALKVLKRNLVESREALLAESRASARFNHPNVCMIYSVEEQDGLPMIVMEYVDGRPLSLVIADGLHRNAVPRLAGQIAAGLAAAHANGVVHGDLKPANVMVGKDGMVKVLDFGLAMLQRSPVPCLAANLPPAAGGMTHAAPGVEATAEYYAASSDAPGVLRGSLAYMSPEQSRGLPPTPAADVFAFGLTLVEMLTGCRALAEQTPVRLLMRLQDESLSQRIVGKVDAAYRDLIAAMLAYDPCCRPTMAEVAQHLAAKDFT